MQQLHALTCVHDHQDYPLLEECWRTLCTREWLDYYCAHGVGIGFRIKQKEGNREIPEPCISVFVEVKDDALPDNRKFDRTLPFHGATLGVDVLRSPVAEFQALDAPRRPVCGGLSCSLLHAMQTGVTGTAGAWAVNRDGRSVLLSNAHVFGHTVGEPVIQQGASDFGRAEQRIGVVAETMQWQEKNRVDCALALPDSEELVLAEVPGIGPAICEIRAGRHGMKVEMVGKASGHTCGRVTQARWRGQVTTIDGDTRLFEDVLVVTADPDQVRWSKGGDSGAVVFAREPGETGCKPAVGVHFAGTSDGSTGYVCRIEHVFEMFGLQVIPLPA